MRNRRRRLRLTRHRSAIEGRLGRREAVIGRLQCGRRRWKADESQCQEAQAVEELRPVQPVDHHAGYGGSVPDDGLGLGVRSSDGRHRPQLEQG